MSLRKVFCKNTKADVKRLWHRYFLWVLRKFSRTPFLQKKDKDTPFCRVSSSIYDQNNWNVSLKKFNFNKAADLFYKRSSGGCFHGNKNRHFVQNNDKRKMQNTHSKIKNNANNETKLSKA